MAFVRSGATRVELMEPDDKSVLGDSKTQVIHHVGYLVSDIAEARRALESRGARFQNTVTTPLGFRIAYFDGLGRIGARQHLTQE
ncbi:MAG: VOC family protein [Chloroflexota bacterium]